jgi:hypothetical protein
METQCVFCEVSNRVIIKNSFDEFEGLHFSKFFHCIQEHKVIIGSVRRIQATCMNCSGCGEIYNEFNEMHLIFGIKNHLCKSLESNIRLILILLT